MSTAPQPYLSFDVREFRVRLARAGYPSFSSLARAVGFSGQYVRAIGAGLIPPEDTRKKVADALGVAPERIWKTEQRAA